jgi:hypothetical protein
LACNDAVLYFDRARRFHIIVISLSFLHSSDAETSIARASTSVKFFIK